MASEKRLSISFTIAESGLTATGAVSATGDLSGSDFTGTVISATTSWVAVPLGSLASFESIFIRNLDATNYVQLATANDGTKIFARLQPGSLPSSCIYLPLDSAATLYIKANTAACDCQVVATEP